MKWRDGLVVVGVLAICCLQVFAANYCEKTVMNPFTGKLDCTLNGAAIQGQISSSSAQLGRYSTHVSKSYVSNGRFTNNSTYTAAHIRALVDPHPAPGNNRNVAYNNAGSWAGASLLNYSGGKFGVGTRTPAAALHLVTDEPDSFSTSRGFTLGQHGSNIAASVIAINRSRGTYASPSNLASGDNIAAFHAKPYDALNVAGDFYMTNASLIFTIDGTTSNGVAPTSMSFWTGYNAATRLERMRVTSAGKIGVGTTVPRSLFDNASSSAGRARATIGSATNVVIADQNLGIRLKGNAVNWDDVAIPLSIVRLSTLGTPPTWAAFQGTEVPSFSATATNTLYFTLQLPHWYQEGANISCHVHMGYPNANAGNVRMQITHSWANVNAAFPAATTVATTFAAPAVANQHVIHDFGTLTGTGKTISSVILFSLARLGADAADTYGSVNYGVSFDCHIPKDGLGSDTATTKTATP